MSELYVYLRIALVARLHRTTKPCQETMMRLLLFCGVLASVPGVFCGPESNPDPDLSLWGLPARLAGFRSRGLEDQGREKRKGPLDGRIRILKMLQEDRKKPRQEKRAQTTTATIRPKNFTKLNTFLKLAELQLKSINEVFSQEKEDLK